MLFCHDGDLAEGAKSRGLSDYLVWLAGVFKEGGPASEGKIAVSFATVGRKALSPLKSGGYRSEVLDTESQKMERGHRDAERSRDTSGEALLVELEGGPGGVSFWGRNRRHFVKKRDGVEKAERSGRFAR